MVDKKRVIKPSRNRYRIDVENGVMGYYYINVQTEGVIEHSTGLYPDIKLVHRVVRVFVHLEVIYLLVYF